MERPARADGRDQRRAVGGDVEAVDARVPDVVGGEHRAVGRALDHRGVDDVHVLVAVGRPVVVRVGVLRVEVADDLRQRHQAVGVGILLAVGLAVAVGVLEAGVRADLLLDPVRQPVVAGPLDAVAAPVAVGVGVARVGAGAELGDVPQAVAVGILAVVARPVAVGVGLARVGAGRLLAGVGEAVAVGILGPVLRAVAVGVLLAGVRAGEVLVAVPQAVAVGILVGVARPVVVGVLAMGVRVRLLALELVGQPVAVGIGGGGRGPGHAERADQEQPGDGRAERPPSIPRHRQCRPSAMGGRGRLTRSSCGPCSTTAPLPASSSTLVAIEMTRRSRSVTTGTRTRERPGSAAAEHPEQARAGDRADRRRHDDQPRNEAPRDRHERASSSCITASFAVSYSSAVSRPRSRMSASRSNRSSRACVLSGSSVDRPRGRPGAAPRRRPRRPSAHRSRAAGPVATTRRPRPGAPARPWADACRRPSSIGATPSRPAEGVGRDRDPPGAALEPLGARSVSRTKATGTHAISWNRTPGMT